MSIVQNPAFPLLLVTMIMAAFVIATHLEIERRKKDGKEE